MNAREVLETMVRTDRGSMTVWSPAEVRDALDAYRAEVLREAADALEARVADVDVDTRTTWAGMDATYLRVLATTTPCPDIHHGLTRPHTTTECPTNGDPS